METKTTTPQMREVIINCAKKFSLYASVNSYYTETEFNFSLQPQGKSVSDGLRVSINPKENTSEVACFSQKFHSQTEMLGFADLLRKATVVILVVSALLMKTKKETTF